MRKRILISSAMAALLLGNSPLSAGSTHASDFSDVSPTAWYYDAVEYASENGLFAGTSETTFDPDIPMTRGMFVTVLGRQAEVSSEKQKITSFSDVISSAYYAPYVAWASESGIVSGKGNRLFGPNDPLTREQMVTILHRYAQFAGLDLTTGPTTLDAYPDQSKVAGYAQQAMTWAVAHHIVGGADGKLLPKTEATRAQVAQVFYNARELLKRTEACPESASEEKSDELSHLRRLLDQLLPPECKWNEDSLQAGWYGPMQIGADGDLKNIAKGCVYMLTQIDGFTYRNYYIEERSPGTFFLYYG